MTLFTVLFSAFMADRAQHPQVFRVSEQQLSPAHGVVNTLLLLTSSLCVATALRAVRQGAIELAPRLLMAAFVGGLGFVASKGWEYSELVHAGFTPATSKFFAYYYTLTWLHLIHLVLALGVLVFLLSLSRRRELTTRQFGYLEGGACFWHMVDLVWLVLFPLVYLVR